MQLVNITSVGQFRTPPRLPYVRYDLPAKYLITCCCKNRDRPFAEDIAAAAAREAILEHRAAGRFWLYAYCVMPDHVHLFICLRQTGRHLSNIVASLKITIKRKLSVLNRSFNWQRGYHERSIRGFEAPSDVARYVRLNPVRAGLVAKSEDYSFAGCVDPWY